MADGYFYREPRATGGRVIGPLTESAFGRIAAREVAMESAWRVLGGSVFKVQTKRRWRAERICTFESFAQLCELCFILLAGAGLLFALQILRLSGELRSTPTSALVILGILAILTLCLLPRTIKVLYSRWTSTSSVVEFGDHDHVV
mmetsp:Transcript_12884/g.33584  ORF Transcript_12884/g.33584 Transcript_12884/m.33584 type:complete len:146 (+) Transcript_12884:145-582(+)|eukprot:CAMPEP_0119419240 /NCGR_PEP_ID=MMETSP1335-20130426/20271_1 /TAXON_ID=259385 /ORGANISM="Chrysoculter rhomboideus, Strain RCC1486" /LENGTH=145 /DNA_ID=CAMNT_0007444531 /DNA_START=56 /DNA_END=493 /DNA_ORIENTATION=-